MTRQLDYPAMQRIFTRFQQIEPEPKGELHHSNAFTLVVAVALSAQATDVGVNRATEKLFQIADTPEKMLALGEEGLIEHIKTIGLFRNKAKNVIRLCQILIDTFGGQVPSSRAAELKTPARSWPAVPIARRASTAPPISVIHPRSRILKETSHDVRRDQPVPPRSRFVRHRSRRSAMGN